MPEEEPGGRTAAPQAGGTPDIRLLEMLVCPVSKASLIYDKDKGELISRLARLAYPIRSGVPILVASEARELGDDEVAGASRHP